MNTLIIYKSVHQGNTRKIAETMGRILDADIVEPDDFDIKTVEDYDLIGFGSGIYDGGFHKSIMSMVDELPDLRKKPVFLFSTAGVIYEKSHRSIREKLINKNAIVIDEFYCKGLNKNSFLKYFGGMNKGRPSAEDLEHAARFAQNVIRNV